VIIGDWLSEANMTVLSGKKIDQNPTEKSYETGFLEVLESAITDIAKYGIKVAVNAGGLDPKGLHADTVSLARKKGLNLKVAWIEGDDVIDIVKHKMDKGRDTFSNITTGEKLSDWPFTPIGAQAYLGGLGIAAAFEAGADIVIAGRVSDASPVIGAASWWHGWSRDSLSELANSFVAGHLIECSNYVCGGNFTGFKTLDRASRKDIGYPIAEIGGKGEVVITMQKGRGGAVTEDTCSAQLLYEIQGPWYFNSDVTAILDEIWFEQLETNRVALRGVKAGPPPPTTKIGITARGGYQAELHYFAVGLDIDEKATMLEEQVRHEIDTSNFRVLEFTRHGTAAENPRNQNEATVDFRIFAQSSDLATVMPSKFCGPIMGLIMSCYPGGTFHLDYRQSLPKPFFEYYVTLLPQADINHTVHTHNGRILAIPPPTVTKVYPSQQPSQSVTASSKTDFGETTKGPLGWIVHARSGDKGSNANVGFWVRHKDEYEWLQTLLSVENMKSLLADEYNKGKVVSKYAS
jgi:hypothetical protein